MSNKKNAPAPAYHNESYVGELFTDVTPEHFINARGPYRYRVLYDAFRPMDHGEYIPLLRRTIKSVNRQLIRYAGFPRRKHSRFQSNLQMLDGMVVLHGHNPKPLVEVVCNVNQAHCLFTPHALQEAFCQSKCFESMKEPYPLIDAASVKVTSLSGEWDDQYVEDIPYVLTLIGGRCVNE